MTDAKKRFIVYHAAVSERNMLHFICYEVIFMKKKVLYTEVAYVLGLLGLALGTAGMERSSFGVSMVVAPAYLLHLKVSEFWPFFSFGMSEYMLQGVLLIITVLCVRKFKFHYLFSFVTAVLYGLLLDGCMALVQHVPADTMAVRVVFFAGGFLFCTAGVSMMFHTFISGEVYELFVMEVSKKFGKDIHKFKTCYDIASCLVGIALSFLFFGFGNFVGIRWGTIICTLLNGYTVSRFTHLFEKHFEFRDGTSLRKYFS